MDQFDSDQAARIAREIGDFLAHDGEIASLDPACWLDELGGDLSGIDARLENGADDEAIADDLVCVAAGAIRGAATCGPPDWGCDALDQAQGLAFSLAGTFLSESGTGAHWEEWLGAIWGAHEMAREQLAVFDEDALEHAERMEIGRSLCLNFLLIAGGAIAALLAVLPAGQRA